MTKKMLIDAAHPEQTRVAIIDGNRVEEFDFESRQKKQLRGNIYLAKVTRVEASLQAAFVEYGGNRHGFLAFNEIHPDYYQIPVEDRMKLLEAEAEEAASESEEVETSNEDDTDESASTKGDDVVDPTVAEEAQIAEEAVKRREKRRRNNYRRYKIQEVIKPGQILLIQVVKEERGNKGAALTTYLSLAGRYCVLMPNTAKGGGISRKITNASDRKRLKQLVGDLDVRTGMGLIIRTAGSKRNKTEIKRDYEYLLRLWNNIRDETLQSVAPSMVHEEGGLVRRAVRDLFDKDIDAIWVDGDEAFKDAKSFMKTLMPSHKDRVKHHQADLPVFLHHKIEEQLESIHSQEVQLKSGGYLVIHQTEALVAVDVNSGRATRERNVEATALKTNLEAAEETCRQMRLRDLAGLIVIDFIDMEENKNNRAVEKRMKDSLKRDRARVQVGRISGFGLFEMSRQRRRASVIEGTSQTCPTCNGLGVVRSIESSALQALHNLESESMLRRAGLIRLTAPTDVGLYILNEKRAQLAEIENQNGVRISVLTDASLTPPNHLIELEDANGASIAAGTEKNGSGKPKKGRRRSRKPKNNESAAQPATEPKETKQISEQANAEGKDQASTGKPKSRKRGRRGGRGRGKPEVETTTETTAETSAETIAATSVEKADTDLASSKSDIKASKEETAKPRRKVRRSRSRAPKVEHDDQTASIESVIEDQSEKQSEAEAVTKPARPARRRRPRATPPASAPASETAGETDSVDQKPAPKKRRRKPAKPATATKEKADSSNAAQSAELAPEKAARKPVKRTVRKRPASTDATNASNANTADKPDAKKPARRRSSTAKKATTAKEAVDLPTADKAPVKKVRKRKTAVSKPATKAKTDTKAEAAEPAKPVRKRAVRKKPAAPKATSTDAKPDEATSKAKPEDSSQSSEDSSAGSGGKTRKSWRSRLFGGSTE